MRQNTRHFVARCRLNSVSKRSKEILICKTRWIQFHSRRRRKMCLTYPSSVNQRIVLLSSAAPLLQNRQRIGIGRPNNRSNRTTANRKRNTTQWRVIKKLTTFKLKLYYPCQLLPALVSLPAFIPIPLCILSRSIVTFFQRLFDKQCLPQFQENTNTCYITHLHR